MYLLQDWTTIAGNGTTPFVQSALDWMDLARYADAVFWLEVRAVSNPGAGSVTLSYETSPVRDGTLFQAAASTTLVASTTPVVTKVRVGDDPAVPLARWIRFKLEGTAAGDWSVTFRIFAAGGRGSTGVFDPSTLSLTGWWRASYSGSPWSGTASAGSSGSRGLAEGTNPPATGSALNGLTPADFDGTNDQLSNGTSLNGFIDAAEWWSAVLFKVDAFTTNDAQIYNNVALANDAGGFWAFYVKGSGGSGTLYAYQWDGSAKSASAAITTGTWYLAVAWYDGTDLHLVLNGVTQTPAAAGNITVATYTMRVGQNYQGAAFGVLDGQIAELAIAGASGYGASEAAGFKSYVNARYALSL